MPQKAQRPGRLGTNFHLDAFRPWLTGDRLERHIPAMAARGFSHVRVVGEPVLPSADGRSVSDPSNIVPRLLKACREGGITALTLCWNVVAEEAAAAYPLVDAQGNRFARGHWGLFNFSDDTLREISLRSLISIAEVLREHPDVFQDFQPTNEWLLAGYPPHGWHWPAYAGEMKRVAASQTMYDDRSLERWAQFLGELPDHWRGEVLRETGATDLADVVPPDIHAPSHFSATRLAWARFRSVLLGDYLVEVYDRVKPHAAHMRLLSQAAMPVPLLMSGLEAASLGHNPEYWFKRGKQCDVLAVNTYDEVWELTAYPGHLDSNLELPAWMMYFSELARAYEIPALAITEQGGNSYCHAEDTQRYLVMRGAFADASFELDTHTHLLWNDEPSFEGVHEQFYGIYRDQHLQPKPAAHEVERVRWVIERAAFGKRDRSPRVMVVLPREGMDVGAEGWTADTLAGQWRQLCGVTTDSLIADRGVPATTTALIFAGKHSVGSARTIEQAFATGADILIYAGALEHGVDPAEGRERTWRRLTGLAQRAECEKPPEQVELTWHGEAESAGAMKSLALKGCEWLAISRSALPEGAVALCVAGRDRVLAYRHGKAIVTALPLGRPQDDIDPDLTRWTIALIEAAVRPGLKLPFDVLEMGNMTFHLVGDILTVVNSGPQSGRAKIAFGEQPIIAEIDVIAGHFSAVQLSATPQVAVLAGAGKILVDGKTVIESDLHGSVAVAPDGIRVEPIHNPDGEWVTRVAVNGVAAQRDASGGSDIWTASAVPVGTPVKIATARQKVMEASGLFRRELALTDTSWTRSVPDKENTGNTRKDQDFAGRHTLIAPPHRAWVEWSGRKSSAGPITIRFEWWSGDGKTQGEWERKLEPAGLADRIALPLPEAYPCLVRCVVDGADDESNILLAYEADDVMDTLVVTVSDEILRCRVMHPMRRERFDIASVTAFVNDRHGRRVAKVMRGQRGMHARHLQWSEDWIEILAPAVPS